MQIRERQYDNNSVLTDLNHVPYNLVLADL